MVRFGSLPIATIPAVDNRLAVNKMNGHTSRFEII